MAKRFKIGKRIVLSESLVFIELARLDTWSVSWKLNDDSLSGNNWRNFLHIAGAGTLSCQWLLGQQTSDLALERE